jgi:hypothetical protein
MFLLRIGRTFDIDVRLGLVYYLRAWPVGAVLWTPFDGWQRWPWAKPTVSASPEAQDGETTVRGCTSSGHPASRRSSAPQAAAPANAASARTVSRAS